jgi:hypothetical protein
LIGVETARDSVEGIGLMTMAELPPEETCKDYEIDLIKVILIAYCHHNNQNLLCAFKE